MSELKPCPNGEWHHVKTDRGERYEGDHVVWKWWAGCHQRGCGIAEYADTEADAIAAWNRRSDPNA